MSGDKVSVECCKGINGLEKVVLREARGSSAEVTIDFFYYSNSNCETLGFLKSMCNLASIALRFVSFFRISSDLLHLMSFSASFPISLSISVMNLIDSLLECVWM